MVDSVSDENQGATRLSMSQGMMAGSNIDGGGSTRRDNNNNHLTLPVGAHARSRSVSRDVDVNEELQSSNTMPDYWNSRNSPSIIRHQSQPQPGLASLDIEFGRLRVHSNDFGEAFSATQNQAQHSKSEEAVNFMASRGLSSQKPIVRKVLSLDGGGVRGLSTIFILKSLMYSLETRRGIRVEPWQEFDLIGGTSTGGLLAIMLGRLRMSLDECEEAYLNLSRMIFAPVHHKANATGRLVNFVEAKGKFKHKPLEQCIKDILGRKGLPEDQLLREDDESACKSFVCAVTGYEHTKVLRSYKKGSYDSLLGICKIWEAARATSAASTLFEPITIGPYNEKFVDGALRHNNPINLAYVESSRK
jgi:predicted acylesterase/phospholipase RssA